LALRTAELRSEVAALGSELRGQIADLRSELRTEIVAVSSDLKAEIASLRAELLTGMFRMILGAVLVNAIAMAGLMFAFAKLLGH
jgi:hypothetical protein